MMLGIGLGIMAILCAVGLIAGGGLFMHHEMKDKKDQPAIERGHDHSKGQILRRAASSKTRRMALSSGLLGRKPGERRTALQANNSQNVDSASR